MSDNFNLEAEVRDLCARRDINNAVGRYMRGLDRLDRELNLSAFHDDAMVEVGMMNGTREEFVDFAQGFLSDMIATQHYTGQVTLDIRGNEASGEVYFYAWHRVKEDDGEKDLVVGGRYIDEYECRDGDWRITKRAMVVDWSRTDPESDNFTKGNADMILGKRDKSDFSSARPWNF